MVARISIVFILLNWGLTSFAQNQINYNWQAPQYNVAAVDTALNGIILLDYRAIDFKKIKAPYISISKKKKIIHQQIYLNNDSIIQKYSLLRIPVDTVSDLLRLQIRILSKNEKREMLLEVLRDSLKTIEDEVRISIDGIKRGDILEYLYEIEMAPNAYGSETFQTDLPVKYASLSLTGNGLAFDWKGYNGAVVDNGDEGIKKHEYHCVLRSIPAFTEEYYAANEANKMRIDYAAKGMNWSMMSQVIALNVIYTKRKVTKKIQQILENDIQLSQYTDKSEKVVAIEKFIKQHYEMVDETADQYTDLSKILASGKANDNGIVYLFAAFLNAAAIPYEVAATTDRFAREFDSDFATPLNLGYFLFYFSDEQKFLTPYPYRYPYGMVPDYLVGQEALSVSGSFSKGKGMISNHRFIEIENADDLTTEVTEEITVDIPKEGEIFISKMIDLSGYRAIEFKDEYTKADNKIDYVIEFLAIDNVKLSGKVMINGKADLPEQLEGENVIIYVELEPNVFIGISGDGFFVFHIGQLMGTQMQLNDTLERSQDISLNYPIAYHRQITLLHDAGYKILGTEDLKMAVGQPENMFFNTLVQTAPGRVEVDIQEDYRFLTADKAIYPKFKETINAAAAFQHKSIEVILE